MLQLLLLGLSTLAITTEAGKWEYPPGCSYDCVYRATWDVDVVRDLVKFTIVANQSDKTWTAIAFSKEKKMQKAEVIYGYINSKGKGVILDGWIPSTNSAPLKDAEQNLVNTSIYHKDGYLTLTFSHPRISYGPREYNFTDTDCYYFIFPIGGGSYSNDNGLIKKHNRSPEISNEKMCFVGRRDNLPSAIPTSSMVSESYKSETVKMVSTELHTILAEHNLTTENPKNIEDLTKTVPMASKVSESYKSESVKMVSSELYTTLGMTATLVVPDEKRGKWVYPHLCERNASCLYKVTWELDVKENVVKFVIEAKQVKESWTGIGFAVHKNLKGGADFIYGFVNSKDESVVIDGKIRDLDSLPEKDKQQDLINPVIEFKYETLIMSFSRKRHTTDPEDTCFTDVDCPYLVFPIGGGKLSDDGNDIKEKCHLLILSDEKICIRERGHFTETIMPKSAVTTAQNPNDIIDMSTPLAGSHEKSGEWVYPPMCEQSCLYKASWVLDTKEDVVKYDIVAKQTQKSWTGIGFTKDHEMNSGDIIYGFVNSTGHGYVVDGWIRDRNDVPEKDSEQNILNYTVVYENGLLKMTFYRKRHLTDPHDVCFTDINCYYFIFPVEGGELTEDGNDIKKYTNLPIVSNDTICIRDLVMMATGRTMLTGTKTPVSLEDDFTKSTVSHVTLGTELNTNKLPTDSTKLKSHVTLEDDYTKSTVSHVTLGTELITNKLPVDSTKVKSDVTLEDDFTKSTMSHLTMPTEIITKRQPDDIINIDYKRICYFPSCSQYRTGNAKFLPEDIDPSLCSHLIFAFANLVDNKLVPYDMNDDIPNGMYERFNKLKLKSNVKTLLAVGGKNFGTTNMTAMLKTKENRHEFVTTSIEYLRKRNFDGLELDFEYPGCKGSPAEDKQLYTSLIEELRKAFDAEAKTSRKPVLLLMAGVPAVKQYIDNGYEVAKISKHLDFMNLMTYDFINVSDSTTGHHAPLFPGSNVSTTVDQQKNMAWAANYWVTLGAPKEKLIIGMATYGRGFKLQDPNNHGIGAPTVGPSPAGKYTNETGIMSYYEICPLVNDGTATRVWLTDEKVPYIVKDDIWIGYDDEMSLTGKVNWLKETGYMGWMVCMTDFDDFKGQFCNKGPYPLIHTLSSTLLGNMTTASTPLSKILLSTSSMILNTETNPTEHHMTMVTPEAEEVTCKGRKHGSYPYPGKCNKYIECGYNKLEVKTCDPDTYFDITIETCTFKDALPEERRKKCGLF